MIGFCSHPITVFTTDKEQMFSEADTVRHTKIFSK